jgi:hypothetical protein
MNLRATLITILSLICLNIGLHNIANATIYTWTDEEGKKHFSDQPSPKNGTATDVKTIVPKSHNNIKLVSRKNSQWQQDYNAAQEKKAELAAIQTADKEENAIKCAQIRNRISTQSHKGRIYKINAQGEREYQSSEQIDNAKKQLAKDLKQYCS